MKTSQRCAGVAGIEIRYTVTPSPFGFMLVAATTKGICAVGLHDDEAEAEAALRHKYTQAALARDEAGMLPTAQQILAHVSEGSALELPLDVCATNFQRRVWDALRGIPRGETRAYAQIAAMIGQPEAARAVAQACASNILAIAIPCHRALGKDGRLSGYRWGIKRKEALLRAEGRWSLTDDCAADPSRRQLPLF